MDLPNFWIVTDPAAMGNDLGGLRNPDAVVALVIDGFSTDDGSTFDKAPFARGTSDAIFMVLDSESGTKVFDRMAGYVQGRPSRKENVESDNEVVVGKWELASGQVALMVADAGGVDHAQSAFEKSLGFEDILLQRSDKAVMSSRFDVARVLADNKDVFSDIARQALEELTAPVAPAPRRKNGGPR